MKLQAERIVPLKRLHRKIVALGEQLGPARQLKAFAMPVIDLAGPIRAQREPRRGWTDRVVTDLGPALRMRGDLGAKLSGEHLRAEADAEERPPFPQRYFDPIDLAANIVVAVIGTHRAAQNYGAGMLIQGFGQRVAKARTADIEPVPEPVQGISDAARGRGFLMQDDQHRPRGF